MGGIYVQMARGGEGEGGRHERRPAASDTDTRSVYRHRLVDEYVLGFQRAVVAKQKVTSLEEPCGHVRGPACAGVPAICTICAHCYAAVGAHRGADVTPPRPTPPACLTTSKPFYILSLENKVSNRVLFSPAVRDLATLCNFVSVAECEADIDKLNRFRKMIHR
ncbi:unnamed protein product [Colias eurytheme]|nr:unnamed protein product [Colias eurytheme]